MPPPGVIREAMTDRQQWALFIGHMVLGLLVLGPVLYYATAAVATDVARVATDKVDSKVLDIRDTINTIERQQAVNMTKILGIERDLDEIKATQRQTSEKIDRLLERVLRNPPR